MKQFEALLEKYARLLIQKGLQVQPGENVMIYIQLDQLPLARLLQREAYKAGAKRVHFTWQDDELNHTAFEYAEADVLSEYPEYKQMEDEDLIKNQKISRLSVVSNDPDIMSDINMDKLSQVNRARAKNKRIIQNATMNDEVKWTVAAAAGYGWAKHVFPELANEPEKCVDALWDQIFTTCRVYEEDPVAAWDAHRDALEERAQKLNDIQFDKLHYMGPGTDFTVGLPKDHIWISAESISKQGETFIANMPTEEVFTAPDTHRMEGKIVSTKPLSYQNHTIEGIEVHFHNGQITEISAERGDALMKQLVADNDGARGLGEVALVPHHSPISQSGVTFYNTLFDENASCHIAIGAAYPTTVKGTENDDDETLFSKGINVSDVHVDFMVGSGELDIDGITKDGEVKPIFRKGEWAF